jgi:hypothetical protein
VNEVTTIRSWDVRLLYVGISLSYNVCKVAPGNP